MYYSMYMYVTHIHSTGRYTYEYYSIVRLYVSTTIRDSIRFVCDANSLNLAWNVVLVCGLEKYVRHRQVWANNTNKGADTYK